MSKIWQWTLFIFNHSFKGNELINKARSKIIQGSHLSCSPEFDNISINRIDVNLKLTHKFTPTLEGSKTETEANQDI